LVSAEVARQIAAWNKKIVWIMIEWYLKAGNQPLSDDLKPGVSVTDACVDWDTNRQMINELNKAVEVRNTKK
jgi:3-deoxy-7-phosphoheptulonate synthase